MRCMITASLRANATRARLAPRRRVTATPQARSFDGWRQRVVVPKSKLIDQRSWFAVYLSLPNKLTVMVEHTDSRFLQRDVEANYLAHGSLRLGGVGREPSGEDG
jgi:hypothetical protein